MKQTVMKLEPYTGLKQYLGKEYKLFTSYPFNDNGIRVKIDPIMWGNDCLWAHVIGYVKPPNSTYSYGHFRFVPKDSLDSGEYRLVPMNKDKQHG